MANIQESSPNACLACPARENCACSCQVAAPTLVSRAAPIPLPHAGKTLYGAGTPAFAIYVVRAGCLKTVTSDTEGKEHVRKFHFTGDLVGLDALGAATYPSSAVAVTPSQVCRVSKGELHQLTEGAPQQMRRLLEYMSHQLREALTLSGDYTAEQRVAAFVLAMEARLASNVGAGFELPMTRRDMASHLRLATETVCRVLGRFADQDWLQGGQELKVLQRESMLELARPVGSRSWEMREAA